MKVAKCAASYPPRINIYRCFLSDIIQIPVDLNLPINDYRTAENWRTLPMYPAGQLIRRKSAAVEAHRFDRTPEGQESLRVIDACQAQAHGADVRKPSREG